MKKNEQKAAQRDVSGDWAREGLSRKVVRRGIKIIIDDKFG